MPELLKEWWGRILSWIPPERVADAAAVALRVFVLLVVGFVVARLLSAWASRIGAKRFDVQTSQLARRGIFYGTMALVVVAVLQEVGFELSVFLGAAGVLTVALGFASQTAASNLISGLFLVGERPFQIGDTVQIGAEVGEVLSIEWLSVRVRTFDNRLIRIPNEVLLKSNIVNLTRFPIRRMDIPVAVAYAEDLGHVREVILGVAKEHPACLDEPEAKVWFQGFGASSLDLLAVIWTRREGFVDTRSDVRERIKKAFDAHGIEIPFPQQTLVASRDGRPIPVAVAPEPPKEPAP